MDTYGYGVCLSDILAEINDDDENMNEAFLSFVKDTEVEQEWRDYRASHSGRVWRNIDDYGGEYFDNGIVDIFSFVLKEKSGIEFYGDYDGYGKMYIVYEPIYPWKIKDFSRLPQKEDIDKIFRHCLSVFCPRDKIKISYQEIKNDN